jgi:predicted transposase/invertase (TIGR01784 family)
VRYEAGLKANEDEIDFEEMLEEAKVKSAAEAHAEGIKENQIETAKKMLNMGMSIDLITEISGLSKEEIDGLR